MKTLAMMSSPLPNVLAVRTALWTSARSFPATLGMEHCIHISRRFRTCGHGEDSGQREQPSSAVTPTDSHPTDGSEADEYHDAAHRAQHQATHRVSEKASFALMERAVERFLGRAERGAVRGTERAVEKILERGAEKATAEIAGRIVEHGGERLAERVGERLSEGGIKRVGERMAQHATERLTEVGLERVGERVGERAAKNVAERITERAFERSSENAVIRGVERAAERAVPRAGNAAGERIAERAMSQAAQHAAETGSRVGLERLAERIMLRAGRGLAIALPALGSLFVLHLARADRRRALEEKGKGNVSSCRAFWVAFLCDASDVAAHVVVVTSMLNSHYGVGVALPHEWLHMAEWGGLAAAAISTGAAILGELLAAGWKMRGLSIWGRGGGGNLVPGKKSL